MCETDDGLNLLDLGFLEKVDSWKLESRFFRSKCGGFPPWLSFQDIPSSTCHKCGKCSLKFLLSIYSPDEGNSHSFHRSLFLFMCPICPHWELFRSQLPRENPFYSFEPPREIPDWETQVDPFIKANLCRICGLAGDKKCSRCSQANYCSKDHQIWDWKEGGHKIQCSSNTLPISKKNSQAVQNFLYPEYEIIMEADDEVISDDDDDDDDDGDDGELDQEKLAEEMKKVRELEESSSKARIGVKEITKYLQDDNNEDKIFKRFKKVTKVAPEQVIRYSKNNPLWITDNGRPESIPDCELCGAKRLFEFQVMPQLLSYLKLDDIDIDWGLLAVYTCSKNCNSGPDYKPEFVHRQVIL